MGIFSSKVSREPAEPPEPAEPAVPGKVPLFIMLGLDWMTDDGMALRDEAVLRSQLTKLKRAGLAGIMADVWWGLCEPEPGKYNFGAAKALCGLLQVLGLKFQAVMSFHQCGGNVGDALTIPVPEWAMAPAREKGLLYRSQSGITSSDCLSLSADSEGIFPGPAGARTALACYRDFMAGFARACTEHLGTTVIEIQVGMGPCGELRYPSYMLSNGWQFPGTGLVMAHDAGMLRMLSAATGMAEPPAMLPDEQNGRPEELPFWRAEGREYCRGSGKAFLEWYSKALLDHGAAVLGEAAAAVRGAGYAGPPEALAFSVKVSGLHWHVTHPSRATEASAGYDNCSSERADAYSSIAGLLARAAAGCGHPVIFNFTCMEMNNWSNGMPEASSAPEDLIAQVRRACVVHRVPLAGENALGFDPADGAWAYEQMKKQARGWSCGHDRMHGLTILRLDDGFVSKAALAQFRRFAESI